MALIENAKGRSDGGYTRLLGVSQLGLLLSKVQATVITSGTELEKEIIAKSNQITDLDVFIKDSAQWPDGVYLVSKKTVKQSTVSTDQEPDLLIFRMDSRRKHCYIVELKDGDAFDTKKAQGEKNSLTLFQNHISRLLPVTTSIHICCFNAETRQDVVKGFKHKISLDEAMTGCELCELLGIDYREIVTRRQSDQQANLRYFIAELSKIPELSVASEMGPCADSGMIDLFADLAD